jgi:hypothetical protein
LEQRRPTAVLGVHFQQAFESAHALGDPLGVVKPVHPKDDALSVGSGRWAHRSGFGRLGVLVEVDTDRRRDHLHGPVAVFDDHRVPVDAVTQPPLDTIQKVLGVAAHMEADQVAGEYPEKDLAIPRQQAVDVIWWEGNVKEEREPQIGLPAPDGAAREHQLVVVDPRQFGVARTRNRHPGEAVVDRHVGVPVGSLETGAARERMEQRPERPVREAVVVVPHLRLGQRDGCDAVRIVRLLHRLARAKLAAWPAHPRATPLAEHRIECAHQTTDRAATLGTPTGPAHRERQTIADDHQRPPVAAQRWGTRHRTSLDETMLSRLHGTADRSTGLPAGWPGVGPDAIPLERARNRLLGVADAVPGVPANSRSHGALSPLHNPAEGVGRRVAIARSGPALTRRPWRPPR